MLKIAPVVVVVSAALLASAVHAAPPGTGDDMDKLLADRGLLTQVAQMSQSVSNRASELVVNAMGFLGVPYRRGGNNVETGFDCSGFVRSIYEQSVGLLLPRKAEQQAAATQRIDKTELQPGDLVFFNTMRRAFSHVGIYVGDGKFIHSPKPGAEVRVESMGVSYWQNRFDGARRVTPQAGPSPEVTAARTGAPSFQLSSAAATSSPSAAETQALQAAAARLQQAQMQQQQELFRR